MLARWYRSGNWGDSLNPILIKHLSGITPKWTGWPDWDSNKISKKPVYLIVGSVLKYADKNTIVWGPGFISQKDRLKEKPKKICAVRGPLSRKTIIDQKIKCPKVYGDPALLYPRFYKPTKKKKYKLGIIPHFFHWDDSLLKKFKRNSDVLIIDIKSGIKQVIDSISCCERIASSSLHGIIASDAYNIPSTWIQFSDKLKGDGFKFKDYFASVGRKDKSPLIMDKNVTIRTIFNEFYDYEINIDLDKLLDACPFKNK